MNDRQDLNLHGIRKVLAVFYNCSIHLMIFTFALGYTILLYTSTACYR